MYISSLADDQLCEFVEQDIKKSECINAFRGDDYALDLMADMFAGDHSRDDKHYLYTITKICRTNSYIDVKGYSVRVRCPGQYRSGKSDVVNGNFIYRFSDTRIDKIGNISWNGSEMRNYIKFIVSNLSGEEQEEYKKFYLSAMTQETENLINK